MSLILRQACQPVLDTLKLQNYHVRIDSYLHMTINEECGKELCTIPGITFSRKAPVQKEIEYAKELLEAFLNKHNGKIKTLLSVKAELKQLRDTIYHSPTFKHEYIGGINIMGFSKKKDNIVLSVYKNKDKNKAKEQTGVQISIKNVTKAQLKALNIPQTDVKSGEKLLSLRSSFKEKEKEKEKLEAQLASCDI